MKVAFIGVGTMGGHMAANVLKAGHELIVFDVRRATAEPLLAKGARWADSAAQAAQQAELILTSLPGPREVEAVALGEGGILQGAPRGSVYADLSTSSPTLIRRIAETFKEQGIHVLDAPVSGGPNGAEAGTLQLMVGGDQEVYDRVRPVLLAIGTKVDRMGDVGTGEVAKLCHNMLGYSTALALAEAFTLGTKAGVAPEDLLRAIKGAAFGVHNSLNYRIPQVVFKNDFDVPRFALRLARKDVGLATELGREYNVPMNVASLAEQALVEGMVRGWENKDSSAIWLLQEERAGVEVRSTEEA
jgi:3-hydroxyisobutyrate dehydrogenase